MQAFSIKELFWILLLTNGVFYVCFFIEAPLLGLKATWTDQVIVNFSLVLSYLATSLWFQYKKQFARFFYVGLFFSFVIPDFAGDLISLSSIGGLMGVVGAGTFKNL